MPRRSPGLNARSPPTSRSSGTSRNLGVANPIDRLLPKSEGARSTLRSADHPSIVGASYNVDVSSFNVNILEGQMLPTASLAGAIFAPRR